MEDKKKQFYDIVLGRSNENERALKVLMNQNCYALVGAIIRMELDSLIRVHHFNTLSDNEQEIILDKFFKNEKWTLSD